MNSDLLHVAIGLALGLLVGFQRERAKGRPAGIRTFALITVAGVLSGQLAVRFGGWILGAGVISVLGFLVTSNMAISAPRDKKPGITTEVAAFVMFLTGAILALGRVGSAVVITGTVALLLQWKRPLHTFVQRIGEDDLRFVFRLVLLGLVILPALPNEPYGPYGVINPFRIWLMVVLINGISLAGYIASRFLGEKTGGVVAGLLGGLISSTATTVSASRETRAHPGSERIAGLMIILASIVVFGRVMFEIVAVLASSATQLLPPLAVLMAFLCAAAALVVFGKRSEESIGATFSAPDIKTALGFGLVYMLVLLAVAFAKDYFGDSGLYVAAALSGLTDMDAITLSTAELVKAGELSPATAWRAILVGAMANILFKSVVIVVLGNRALLLRVGGFFIYTIVVASLLIAFWPN